jgi:hypothetical protein
MHLMSSKENPYLVAEYLKLINCNAQHELFHPDEILAQEFVTTAGLPSLVLLLEIDQAMKDLSYP